LWQAFCADEIPYIDRLGDRWGELCADTQFASEWADRLIALTRENFASRRSAAAYPDYFKGTSACFSALFAAGRYDELFALIDDAPYVWWEYRRWGFRVLAEQGQRGEALRYAESSREPTGNSDLAISHACEQLLLQSGMAEEAYRRYAIATSGWESTYVNRFRSLAKRYPLKPKAELLRDLVASTPGAEGKWFAAAKGAGLYDEAIALANTTPSDPKTLARAARDFVEKRPAFAVDAALAALRWFAEGYGYEVAATDIVAAYRDGLRAAGNAGLVEAYNVRTRDLLVGSTNAFLRTALRFTEGVE
jgi:hypothetical protein